MTEILIRMIAARRTGSILDIAGWNRAFGRFLVVPLKLKYIMPGMVYRKEGAMKRLFLTGGSIFFLLYGIVVPANAVVVDFTGGTVYLNDGSTVSTNNSGVWQGVDKYEQGGFRLDFIGNSPAPDSFDTIVGNYYGEGNDVIHGHWATGTGEYGQLTEIRVSKIDGAAFDVNYFVLTSNTDTGGGEASGNEQAYINASSDGVNITYSQLLPPDDWGWAGDNPQIFLSSQFDSVYWFSFTAANPIDCFGMDNFYINEPAPQIPEPATMLLLGSGLIGLAGYARRRFRK
jgi:hypothetical protein